MTDPEQRWEQLWAEGQELDAEQERLLARMEEMDPMIFDRALATLREKRKNYEADLLALMEALPESTPELTSRLQQQLRELRAESTEQP